MNTGGAALGSELERTCLDNELVIAVWSPVHLRTKLQELYWKADKPAIGAMNFWRTACAICSYRVLPRVAVVLEKAVTVGAATVGFLRRGFWPA